MMLYYSASRAGFFEEGTHTLPSDVVPVTAEAHQQLMDSQSAGMVIVANDNGEPIAIARPGPSAEEALVDLRQRRDTMLTACDWTQLPDVVMATDLRAAWAAYRQALRDLPETTSGIAAIEWPVAPA